jgi:N-acetylmuramoyl-L-alanine amidase
MKKEHGNVGLQVCRPIRRNIVLLKLVLMKDFLIRYLLASICGVMLLSSPVKAAVLDSWQFDANQNKLSFTTQGGVQPEAQLITNPTRLVIKLPGTTLGKVEVSRLINGPIKAVNLFQLDGEVAQIIIVLADGYTIDPAQVLFKGISTTEWMVQLPTPMLTAVNPAPVAPPPPQPVTPTPPVATQPPTPPAPPPVTPPPRPNTTTPSNPRQNNVNPRPTNTATNIGGKSATLVEEIRLKDNGIVLKTSGKLAEYELKQGDRGWLTLDIFNATLTAKNLRSSEKYNANGLSITQVSQLSSNPPVVRVNIVLPDNQPWVANAYPDGIILWQEGQKPPAKEQHNGFVTIDQIALKDGTELIISGNQPINYTDGWDPETGAYGITLFNARIKEGLELPKRQVGGSLIWARLRQEDPETVTLLIKPATGVEIGEVVAVSNQLLSLPMGWGLSGNLPSNNQGNTLTSLPNNNSNQNRASNNRRQPANLRNWPRRNNPPNNNINNNPNNNQISLPPLPARDGRTLVVIDPGHGGPIDLGAVGIGGLVEKDIVLEISLQVAQLLQQQGIQVVMTRQDDRDLDLPPRSEIANRVNADLFVSIHANAISMSRPDVNGLETFYYDSGKGLAQDIQASMLQAFPMNDRGVRQARFHVLRNTKMPAVLVEVGFVTGNYDALILANPQQRTRMAQAIARGILRYISNNFPARQ